MKRELLFETFGATMSTAGLVLGAFIPGPLLLKVVLVTVSLAGVAWAFYRIFEGLPSGGPRHWYDPGSGGGGPDGGERRPRSKPELTSHGTVIDFPKRAA